jgi:tyrosinase
MRRYCETDRRAFLQALAGFAAEVVVGMPSMTRAQPMAQFTRRDIRKLDPDSPEIKAVRAGIAVMKARPNTDKTSWSFQANMHGTTLSGNNTIWRKCQHGHWWFFPWHRMYLYYFERILRKAIQQSGTMLPPDFALPYWNYSDEDAARTLPIVLRTTTYTLNGVDVANPLFENDRRSDINDVDNPTALQPDTVSYSDAFALMPFISSSAGDDGFGGQVVSAPAHQPNLYHGGLESHPHDVVHDGIGGLMGDPDTAANDPVFWLHHCNIDRLWNRWLTQKMRSNPDIAGSWARQTFTFIDETGKTVTQPVFKFLEYVMGNIIDYQYDDSPMPIAATVPAPAGEMLALKVPTEEHISVESKSKPKRLGSYPPPLHLTGKRTSVKINVSEPHQQTMAIHIEGKAEHPHEIVLEVGGIDFNSLPRSGYYEIYLNLPQDEQPSRKSKSYVGTMSIFALRQQAHGETGSKSTSGSFSFPVTRTLKRLKEAQAWSASELNVTFVPREIPPGERNDSPRLTFRHVALQAVEKAVLPEGKHE